MILSSFPPMGIYETLFRFNEVTGRYMGDQGTHPWAQGFPLTVPVPGGPELPSTIEVNHEDRMYPKADGQPELRQALADYYNTTYGSTIAPENVAIFAGGRPALFAVLSFLDGERTIAVEETEYTPYWDLLQLLRRPHTLIPSCVENRFRPGLDEHPQGDDAFLLKSNPCNPTGVTVRGEALQQMVQHYSTASRGAVIDEAYEFFTEEEPESAIKYVDNIDETNLFIVGAATKGLQVPGMRIGWVIASREHIEIFRNYSSFGMGGVSRASQLYVTGLLDPKRVVHARQAIGDFYTSQRKRYGALLADLGIELYSGTGGFYHWGALPGGLTAHEFNERLFKHEAGILPGTLCDMARRGDDGPHGSFVRFSFGPLGPDSLEADAEILKRCLG
jgi:aminotransferase